MRKDYDTMRHDYDTMQHGYDTIRHNDGTILYYGMITNKCENYMISDTWLMLYEYELND